VVIRIGLYADYEKENSVQQNLLVDSCLIGAGMSDATVLFV